MILCSCTSDNPCGLAYYRLKKGRSLSSYGTNCAALSGVPKEIIDRAEMYTQLQSRGEDIISMIRGESNEEEMLELKAAEEIAKRFVAWDIDISGCRQIRDEFARMFG